MEMEEIKQNMLDPPIGEGAIELVDNTPMFIDVDDDTDSPMQPLECVAVEGAPQLRTIKSDSDAVDAYLKIERRKIRCPECQRFTAETEEKMLRHIRGTHRGENPFQCSMCDYSTYNKAVFEEHIRRHQGIKPYKCSFCSYCSCSKKNTKKHELIHRPDNPNKCSRCDFIARNSRSLLNHLSTVHPITPTNQTSTAKSNKMPYKCVSCRHKFKDNFSLVQHRRACPVRKKKSEAQKSSKRKKNVFVCGICKWVGNSKPRVLLHLIHHPKQDVDESIIDVSVLRKCGIDVGGPSSKDNKKKDSLTSL